MTTDNELEHSIDMLFGAIDSDPYFSRLDEKTQEKLERELIQDIVDKESWTYKAGREAFLKNPVIKVGNLEFEPIELPVDEYMKIRQTMSQEFRNIDSENFDPRDELIDRTAFSLIGKRYIRPSDEREELFLNDEDTYSAFADAWMKADAAYQGSIRGLPYHIRQLFLTTPDVQPDIKIPYVPEVGEEVEKPGWVSKNKRWIGGLIALGTLGAVGYTMYNKMYNSPKNKLVRFAEQNNIPKDDALSFYDQYPRIVSVLGTDDDVLSSLRLHSDDSSSFANIYKAAMNDPQIRVSRNQVAAVMSDTALELGVNGLTLPSVYTIGNLTVADLQLGLPRHDLSTTQRMIDVTQNSPDIVNFKPLVLEDVIVLDLPPGKFIADFTPDEILEMVRNTPPRDFSIQSKNVARDHWLIGELIEKRSQLVNEPQKHEWINVMLKQLAWDIFDNKGPVIYKPGYYDGKVYTPTDSEVQQLILDFHDYMDQLPANLQSEGIEIPFPYHDSSLLRKYISDETNRSIALMYLADIPPIFFNRTNYLSEEARLLDLYEQGTIDGETFDESLEKAFRESEERGLGAMQMFVEELPKEYETIVGLYPDGKVLTLHMGERDPRVFYYAWLIDRGGGWEDERLPKTVRQYVGFDYNEPYPGSWPAFMDLVDKSNGVDQVLTKNWKAWDLIKFIRGYVSFSDDWHREAGDYMYGHPLAFKAMGIPYGGIAAKPYIMATAGTEWAVPIPDSAIKALKQELPDYGFAIGYGNLMSLYSCVDGAEKDGITEVYQFNGDAPTCRNIPNLYLWVKE